MNSKHPQVYSEKKRADFSEALKLLRYMAATTLSMILILLDMKRTFT